MASAAQRGRGGGRSGALSMFQANGVVYTEGQEEVMGDGERVFEAPTKAERAMAQYQLELVRRQPDSPYWARQPPQRSDQRDLPRYTDRYHPDRHAIACAASLLQHAPLQHGIFPPQLLANFTSRESRRARQAPRRGRTAPTEIDWDNLQAEEKRTGDGEDKAASESEQEDLGDYEDEDEDDYAQNYFDNGEDDDDGDRDDGGDEAAFD